jgi:MerR family copper efflux transcriptional regulator
MADELVTIGEAATRYGLAASTLRWWERQGLLEPAERRGRQRRYGPAELRRIGLIHLARNTGLMSLDQIGALLARAPGTHWHETVRDRIRDLDQQVERLMTAREALTHTLRCPADHPTQCRHLDDVLSQVASRKRDETVPRRMPAQPAARPASACYAEPSPGGPAATAPAPASNVPIVLVPEHAAPERCRSRL